MAYLDSSKIKVYPSGYRGNGINPESFVNSEQNLNEIASRLTSEDSYIAHEDGVNIEFVVKGYLFKALKSDVTGLFQNPSEDTIIYASVTIDEATPEVVGDTYKTLIPYNTTSVGILDVSEEFKGVYFDTTSGNLPLYKYNDDWNVIEDSMMIFSTKRIKNRNDKCINDEFTTTKLNVTGSTSDVVLPDKSINTNEIADSAITTAKIADDAVTRDKLSQTVIPTILDLVYPIGSIYMTTDETFSPASNFGGQWLRINAGQYLISAGRGVGGQYTPGVTGGASSYTFTINSTNLPAHTHYYSITTNEKNMSIGGFSFSGNTGYTDLNHYHYYYLKYNTVKWEAPDANYTVTAYVLDEDGSGDYWTRQTSYSSATISTDMRHSHSYSGTTGSESYNVGGQTATGFTGTNLTTNDPITIPTMPPYYPVYMWQRVPESSLI